MDNPLLYQYQNQWVWRDWETPFSLLPDLADALVYDLGCAHGDHSHKFASLGANVVGIDSSEELLAFARNRGIDEATFLRANIGYLSNLELMKCDGVWASFVAAYFTDLDLFLENISKVLKKGGWLAVTEMSGLFNHEPLDCHYKELLRDFYHHKRSEGIYDFECGDRIEEALSNKGFVVQKKLLLNDMELSFSGPATDDVLAAWTSRLERMKGLKKFMGEQYSNFQNDFLNCLKSEKHVSHCEVSFHLAVKVR